MQVKSIAECSKGSISAIIYTFDLYEATICHKIIILSIFEWLFYTGFTVMQSSLSFLFRKMFAKLEKTQSALSNQVGKFFNEPVLEL